MTWRQKKFFCFLNRIPHWKKSKSKFANGTKSTTVIVVNRIKPRPSNRSSEDLQIESSEDRQVESSQDVQPFSSQNLQSIQLFDALQPLKTYFGNFKRTIMQNAELGYPPIKLGRAIMLSRGMIDATIALLTYGIRKTPLNTQKPRKKYERKKKSKKRRAMKKIKI